MDNNRNELIDIIKGIAIILVIMGHSIQYGSGNTWMESGIFFDNVLFKVIYSFHMPLFMLVSGYLFFFSVGRYTCLENFVKKIAVTLIPIGSWSLLYNAVLLVNNGESFQLLSFIKQSIRYAIGSFWFLWAVFYCSTLVIIVKRFANDSIYIYVIVLLMTFVLPDSYNFYLYKFVYPYFVIGYMFNKYRNLNWKRYDKWGIWAIVLVADAVLVYLFSYETYIYNSRYRILGNEYPLKMMWINGLRFTVGLLGSLLLIKGITIIVSKMPQYVKMIIGRIGANSLGLYLISGFIFPDILAPICCNLEKVDYFIMIVEVVIITIVSYACTILIQKQKVLNLFLLGGKKAIK